MAFSTGILSWCTGRYLSPEWLRWIVFAWVLVLLDCLTIAACLGGPVDRHVGYVLVAAQISLTVLWAALADVNWQWRMPAVLVAAAMVTAYSGTFYWGRRWGATNWDFLMMLTAAVMLLLCGAIRLFGFVLQKGTRDEIEADGEAGLQRHQFGLKHMMIWATALVPILLVARGFNFLVLRRLGGPDLFPLLLVALVIATVNLIAMWSVLGRGFVLLRLAVLLIIPYPLAIGLGWYLATVETSYQRPFGSGTIFARSWYDSLMSGIADIDNSWPAWLWLNAALLAALLLFLRASGYRLIKNRS